MNKLKKITLQCLLISSLCIQHYDAQANFVESYENNVLIKQKLEMVYITVSIIAQTITIAVMYNLYKDYFLPHFTDLDESNNSDLPQTTFADIAGLDEAKESVQDIIEYLKNPTKFKDMGARIPKGLLMSGEPGNGKTLFARAIAGEINASCDTKCSFIATKGSDFASMWLGGSQGKIKELFETARKQAPCIIFIDEIDAVAQKRTGSQDSASQENNRAVMALLNEMDGFSQEENPIIVIGATNRIEALDPAILRPGRFDRKITINKPYVKDRAYLLRISLAKTCIGEDVNIDNLAQATRGFSGAELTNLVNEAIIVAIKDNSATVCMKHIETAYDNITLGCENKGMYQSKESLWTTAVHEAGHLIGFLFQDKTVGVRKVSITPRGNTLGVAHMLPLTESYSFTKSDMENQIIALLAGRCAEEAFEFELSNGASNDLQRAQEIAYSMVVDYGMSDALRDMSYNQYNGQLPNDISTKIHHEVQAIIERCRKKTTELITEHINDIKNIAELLMEKKTILGHEIYTLLHLAQPEEINFNL